MGCGSSKSTVIQQNSQNNPSHITQGKIPPEAIDNSNCNVVQSTSTRTQHHSNTNLSTIEKQNNSPKLIANSHHKSSTQQGNNENVHRDNAVKGKYTRQTICMIDMIREVFDEFYR